MIPLILPYNPKPQGQRLQLQHFNGMHLKIRHCTPVKRGYEIYILEKKMYPSFPPISDEIGACGHFQTFSESGARNDMRIIFSDQHQD